MTARELAERLEKWPENARPKFWLIVDPLGSDKPYISGQYDVWVADDCGLTIDHAIEIACMSGLIALKAEHGTIILDEWLGEQRVCIESIWEDDTSHEPIGKGPTLFEAIEKAVLSSKKSRHRTDR